jgi:hypothetical protein
LLAGRCLDVSAAARQQGKPQRFEPGMPKRIGARRAISRPSFVVLAKLPRTIVLANVKILLTSPWSCGFAVAVSRDDAPDVSYDCPTMTRPRHPR